MQEHYGFTNDQMKSLTKAGVKGVDFMKCRSLFDPESTGEPISQINLYHYIDRKGNFNDPPRAPHKAIAREVFNNLKASEKMGVYKYLDDLENNFEGDEE